MNNSIQRLSAGIKVNRAKDNAANFSIITDLSKRISSMLQVQQNANDGASLLGTAEGGLSQIETLLNRLRVLAVEASNDTYNETSRNSIQTEADQIIEQISQIKANTKFDNMYLFETPKNEATVKPETTTQTIFSNTTQKSARQVSSQSLAPETFTLTNNAEVYTTNSASTLSTQSEQSETVAGAISFEGGETKTVTIDGIDYIIKNRLTTANDLSYSKDKSTDEITFFGSNYDIRGQLDVKHNITIAGQHNNVYGGNLDDQLQELSSTSCRNNCLFGEDGNDTITTRSDVTNVYAGAGDDIINKYGDMDTIHCGSGNDEINIYNGRGNIYGDSGNNVFNIIKTRESMKIYGGTGDDTFNITGSHSGIMIDGGSGKNIVNGDVGNNTTVNVIGANSGVVSIVKDIEQTININGIDYRISTTSTNAELVYKQNDSGQIEFTAKFGIIIIKGDENKRHNVSLNGIGNIYFYGGNRGDNIYSNNANVYTGNGNNNIEAFRGNVYGYKGNNTVIATGYAQVFFELRHK